MVPGREFGALPGYTGSPPGLPSRLSDRGARGLPLLPAGRNPLTPASPPQSRGRGRNRRRPRTISRSRSRPCPCPDRSGIRPASVPRGRSVMRAATRFAVALGLGLAAAGHAQDRPVVLDTPRSVAPLKDLTRPNSCTSLTRPRRPTRPPGAAGGRAVRRRRVPPPHPAAAQPRLRHRRSDERPDPEWPHPVAQLRNPARVPGDPGVPRSWPRLGPRRDLHVLQQPRRLRHDGRGRRPGLPDADQGRADERRAGALAGG